MTITIASLIAMMSFAPAFVRAQEAGPIGFVIQLKNGSSVQGRTLARDESTGKLRLTMTETSDGEPRSYAVISMDDAESIRASGSETDSIRIKLVGGSELRCREFTLGGEVIGIRLGTASRVDVRWEDIESIRFAP